MMPRILTEPRPNTHESDKSSNSSGSNSPNSKNGEGPTSRLGVRKEDLDDVPEAPSPAPAPIKGGEDDVFTVSHIGRIEIKDKPKTPSVDTAAVEQRLSKTAARAKRKRQEERKKEVEEDGSDHSAAPMEVIDKSPYEPECNAEKGVQIFEEMKNLLVENDGDDYRSVSSEATKIFGPTNAWCLVKANTLIDKSGMVYSQEWVNGNIRGNMIGKIPNDLLLLCLVSSRFVKAGEQLLGGISKDLRVYEIVREAVRDWGLEEEFPKIMKTSKNFSFATQKRNCLKCEIFVARAFSCQKAFLGKISIDDSLMNKIKACLGIMEAHMEAPGSSSKRRKKSIETVVVPPAPPVSLDDSAPTKKRRGRPPKHGASIGSSATSPQNNFAEDFGDTASVDMSTASSSNARIRRRSNGSEFGSSNGKKQSLAQLVRRFEIQYEEMGDRYREMGDTLAALKSKIVENRDAMEQEIRDELLQEVQKTILSGLPKKG